MQDTFTFRNEPETDFSIHSNAEAFRAALRDVRSKLGRAYTAIIDGKDVSAPVDVHVDEPG